MKYCIHCGSSIPDDAERCQACGEPVESPAENGILLRLQKYLRWERTAWLVVSILEALSLVSLLVRPGDNVWLGLFKELLAGSSQGLRIFSAIAYIAVLILALMRVTVCLVMYGRLAGLLGRFSQDPVSAVRRCSRAWPIVLGVLFNPVAMIFAIINFACTRQEPDLAALLEEA